MRKIIVFTMITLDGVIQAPGAPDEDTSDGFNFGGWVAPFGDEVSGKVAAKQMAPADLLLGRKTFEIFAAYWPAHAANWPGINEVTKYVFSSTINKSDWQNVVFLKNLEDIKKLKASNGSDIKLWGSARLVQLLLKHDLVDEFWISMYPLVLGKGKKLFDNNASPAAFTLVESVVTPCGVVVARYSRAGAVKTGTIGATD